MYLSAIWRSWDVFARQREGASLLPSVLFSLCPSCSQWSEDDELADAKQNSEWMDECQDGMFEAWYEKIAQEDPEKQRKVRPLNWSNLK